MQKEAKPKDWRISLALFRGTLSCSFPWKMFPSFSLTESKQQRVVMSTTTIVTTTAAATVFRVAAAKAKARTMTTTTPLSSRTSVNFCLISAMTVSVLYNVLAVLRSASSSLPSPSSLVPVFNCFQLQFCLGSLFCIFAQLQLPLLPRECARCAFWP